MRDSKGRFVKTHSVRTDHPRLYFIYRNMMSRCYNPNDKEYQSYGGRGIGVCDSWRNKPQEFARWAFNNGYNEDAPFGVCTIDRMDNDKDYSPENCRWTSHKKQQNNRSDNHLLTIGEETHTLMEWVELKGFDAFDYDAIRKRISRGWDIEKALNTPIKKK